MEVVYWQLLVIGSVAITFISKGQRFAWWVCVGWSAWTLVMLFYLPLILIQLGSCWGTYAICRRLASLSISLRTQKEFEAKIDSELAKLRQQVQEVLDAADATSEEQRLVRRVLDHDPEQIKFISGDKHYSVLKQALSNSKQSVCILSGWIGSPLLDADVQRNIQAALRRGVDIYLGFGWESSEGHEVSRTAREALAFINNLQKQSAQFRGKIVVGRFPNHEKVLACDAFVVIGSNNWLSNRSFRNSERSVMVASKNVVASERSRIQSLVRQHALRADAA
jgi:phosphatidylserine/phosphatidylglycerophosphate/cardiolipin synthase-like enzyme